MPTQPELGEFIRTGNTATLEVLGVDESETVHVCMINFFDLDCRIQEIGSRLGPGQVNLDYSPYPQNFLGMFLQPVFAYAQDEAGNCSVPSSYFKENPMGGTYGESLSISNIHRLADRTKIEFTISGMPEDTQFGVAYTNPNGTVGFQGFFYGNGTFILTGLSTSYRYGLVLIGCTPARHVLWGVGLEPPLSRPSIVPRLKPEIVRR